ncbi:MAG: trypsin-like peptidase domain-containing protein [Chloroflexota bacterium]
MPCPHNELIVELRDIFAANFNTDELTDFALELGVDLEDLPGSSRKAKARELATYLSRHDLIDKLATVGPDARPDIDWVGTLRRYDVDTAKSSGGAVFDVEPAFDVELANPDALEIIVNTEDNFLDIDLLAGAIYTAQAVGRVEMPQGRALGTGFLVGPDLLLTNQHVLKAKSQLNSAVIRFDYRADADGIVTDKGRVFEFMPDLYESSASTELDYALVRVKGEPLADWKLQPGEEDLPYLEMLRRGRHRGYLLLTPSLIVEGERLNIIQHPNGDPQKVVLTQNYAIADMATDRVHYLADTMPGSSGSPILNRHWEVVGIHHSGGPHPPQKMSDSLQKALRGHYKFNEGIPMQAIIPKIGRYLPQA